MSDAIISWPRATQTAEFGRTRFFSAFSLAAGLVWASTGAKPGASTSDFIEVGVGRHAFPEDVFAEVAAFDVWLVLHDFGERLGKLGFVGGFDREDRAFVVDRDGEREIGEEGDSRCPCGRRILCGR